MTTLANRLRVLVWSLCLLLPALFLPAQPRNNLIGDVALPAPQIGALGKFGDVPVSPFTGIPDISLPVHTVAEGPLSLPVSLHYHASGIKVAELAGWTGIGWALQAGGAISRTILGYPDENSPNGYYQIGAGLTGGTQEMVQLLEGQALDTEPDIFQFSFPGYTGKFYIDQHHEPQFVPRQDLQLSWAGTFDQFVIRTPDGTRYYFGQDPVSGSEAIDRTRFQGETFEVATAWHLVRVSTHDAVFSIDLAYEEEQYAYHHLASCWYEQFECTGTGGGSAGVSVECAAATTLIDSHHPVHRTNVRGHRLSAVTTPTTQVLFLAETGREDLWPHMDGGTPARRLDRIEVRSGDFCTRLDLSYDYFHDLRQSGDFPLYELPESKRLKLLQARLSSCDGSLTQPPYLFTYAGEEMSRSIDGITVTRQFLPHRLSKALDHWGFYNDRNENESLPVNVPPTTVTLPFGSTVTYGEADRDVRETAMMTGILRRIDYPTGGHTRFEYEANTYHNESVQYSPEWKMENYPYPNPAEVCGQTESETVFTFDPGLLSQASYQLTLGYPGTGCPNAGPSVSMTVEAYDDLTGNFLGQVGLNNTPVPGTSTTTAHLPLQPFGTGQLPAGSPVRFVLKAQDAWARFEVFSAVPVVVSDLAGGLRIRRITSHDGIDAERDMVRTFHYHDEQDPTRSSGVLLAKPRYGVVHQAVVPAGQAMNYPLAGVQFVSFHADSQVPLGGFDGIAVAYRHVEERQPGNGSTHHHFFLDTAGTSTAYPQPPPQLLYRNGKVRQISLQREDGSLVSETTHSSPSGAYALSPGIIYKYVRRPAACPGPGGALTPVLFTTPYHNRTNRFRIMATTRLLDGVSATTTYEYDPAGRHPYPIREVFTNSDGKVHDTRYRYVFDVADPCMRDALVSRNLTGQPTSTRVFVDGVPVLGDSVQWSFYGDGLPGAPCGSAHHPYPWRHMAWEVALDENDQAIGSGQWSLRGTVSERHSASGLPKVFLRAGGWEPESYEWTGGGLLSRRSYSNFTREFAYLPGTRLLAAATDVDGQETTYQYDGWMRLQSVSSRDGQVKTSYSYDFGTPSDWKGGNRITTLTERAGLDGRTVVEYFDGLGRPADTWLVGHGPQGEDIVAEKLWYDPSGRTERRVYLPDVKSALSYISFEYEPSPLHRVLRETLPDGRQIALDYGKAGNYFRHTATDENEHATVILTDLLGRKTESRDAFGHPTFFRYDAKGNLVRVVNPEQQAYRYTYDARNRVTRKVVPGATCEEFAYDGRDLMVASRDGNLSAGAGSPGTTADQWMVYEYDAHGRLLQRGLGQRSDGPATALCSDPLPADASFSMSDALLVQTFDVQGDPGCDAGYVPIGRLGMVAARLLLPDGTLGDFLDTRYCYDEFGRVGQTTADLFEAGQDQVLSEYDMADQLVQTFRQYNGGELQVTEQYQYDHAGRLRSHLHSLDGITANPGAQLVGSFQYNTRDQLSDKVLGNLAGMAYLFNSRGWLTHVNFMPFDQTTGTLTCTPQDSPEPDLARCAECGEQRFNLEQLLLTRFRRELSVDCYVDCACAARCNPETLPPCPDSPATGLPAASAEELTFPSWLYTLWPCQDTQAQVLEKDLPLLPGPYAVDYRVALEDPDQLFRIRHAEGMQEMLDLQGLLELVNSGAAPSVRTAREEKCPDCPLGPPDCTPAAAAAQSAALATLSANLSTSLAGIQLPTNLLRIRLCSGKEVYLFEEETETLSGPYQVLQTIPLTEGNQLLIRETGSEILPMTLSHYLQVRSLEAGWTLQYYRPCQENRCAETGVRQEARSVGGNTQFSSMAGMPPFQDLSAVCPNSHRSLERDGQAWDVTVSGGSGEVAWDMATHLPLDAELLSFRVVVLIPQMMAVHCRIGLHDGNQFVPVNGGQAYITLDGASFPGFPYLVLTPDSLPSAATLANLQVLLAIDHRSISIDAVYAEADYLAPCDRCVLPVAECSPAEQAAQWDSYLEIRAAAAFLSAADIPVPTLLYRVRLCNGQEVHLLHQELLQLTGSYTILQTIRVGSHAQTFATHHAPPAGPSSPHAGPPPPRYDLFAMQLRYYQNDPQIRQQQQGYGNGNIAAFYWQVNGRDRQAYSFVYDKADRMRHAFYAEIDRQGTYHNRGLYDEWGIGYDKAGNITTLRREGAWGGCGTDGSFGYQYGTIDDLTYHYGPDRTRLLSVTDAVLGDAAPRGVRSADNGYAYDANGNLLLDTGKGLQLAYHYLNLPREVQFSAADSIPAGTIRWVYDATGRKWKKWSSVEGNTWYHDGIERHDDMLFVYFPDGRAAAYPAADPAAAPPAWQYEYALRDHLGNTRLVVADRNGDGYIQAATGDWMGDDVKGAPQGYSEILQENHYYPFGWQMEGIGRLPAYPAAVNRYQFNGMERERIPGVGLDLADFRSYDAALGRWCHIDPLASDFPEWSNYNFVVNNPLRFADPLGLSPEDIIIRGKNGSSITLKTTLIDISVDASRLGIDFQGQYNLEGEAVLSAALDVVGIIDPTGVADALNAGLQARNGDWVGAAVSTASLVPFLGDLSKVFKFKKDMKIIQEAIQETRMYRVQGGNVPNASKERLRMVDGKYQIDGDDMLYVVFNEKQRALNFLNKRGDGSYLFDVKVKSDFYEKIRREAVDQRVGRKFPGKPQQVDRNVSQNSFGIPKEYFDELVRSIER
jgi:RHS repeat-associated protein